MHFHQYVITLPDRFRQGVIERLMLLSCLGIKENGSTFTAYFPSSASVDTIIGELSVMAELLALSAGPGAFTFHHSVLQDQDWNASWKRGFTAIDVGRQFTILPPWESPSPGRIPLIIDPGMAFGTGHHETTRSCLILMERCAQKVTRGSFLDIGTGTGLLAIAALRLRFRKVEAIDIDVQAVEAAQRNIELNAAGRIELKHGDVSAAAVGHDLIAANLISGVLIAMAGGIAACLQERGIAVLSGILQGQENDVIRAMEKSGLACREQLHDGKWVSLVCGRAGNDRDDSGS